MSEKKKLLEVKDMYVSIHTDSGVVQAVRGVSFDLYEVETLAIVGESGSGKSITNKAIMGLLPIGGRIDSGTVLLGGKDITHYTEKQMRDVRGAEISMIFQDPLTSLNPTMTVGKQITEMLMLHKPGMTKEQRKERAIELLGMVGIPNPTERFDQYPHQFSGGMRQRVMISIALACEPKILIADEPTTALDVTIQAQILDLLRQLKDKINSSIMLITHDLGVVANMADYVVVMYAGRVIEKGTAEEVFHHPCHPYTIGLMKSKPVVGKKVEELYNIPGSVPNPVDMPNYCYFKDRCEMQCEQCKGKYPPEIAISDTHIVSCYRFMDKGEVLGYPKSTNVEELLNG